VPGPVPVGHGILDWRAETGQVTQLYMARHERVTERAQRPAPLNQFRHNPTMPGQAARCHAQDCSQVWACIGWPPVKATGTSSRVC
jgi:hypothetical protein